MKANTLIKVVVAVVGVAAGGLLMWSGDTHRSSTFQPTTSVQTALPSSISSSPLPSQAVLPQSTEMEVSSDVREEPLEPEVNLIPERPSSSSVASVLPLSTSSSPLPSQAVLPQSTVMEVSSDVREEPLEPGSSISEKTSSSDLATQLSLATQPPGPADTCVEITKTVLCPIIGQIPFVRDWAGQFAVWAKTSCPMGDPAT